MESRNNGNRLNIIYSLIFQTHTDPTQDYNLHQVCLRANYLKQYYKKCFEMISNISLKIT